MKSPMDLNEKQKSRFDMIKKTSIFIWFGYFVLTVVLEYYINIQLYKPGVLSLFGFIVMLSGIVITHVAGDIFFKQNFT